MGLSTGDWPSSTQVNLHLTVPLAHFVGADAAGTGTAEDLAGAEIKFGVMPRAGDAAILDRAKGDRGIGVGTEIIDRIKNPFVPNKGNAVTVKQVGAAFAFEKIFGAGDFLKSAVGHGEEGVEGQRKKGFR